MELSGPGFTPDMAIDFAWNWACAMIGFVLGAAISPTLRREVFRRRRHRR